jgi:cyclophilin family peptidyl-prolyl cis-trans isomerase
MTWPTDPPPTPPAGELETPPPPPAKSKAPIIAIVVVVVAAVIAAIAIGTTSSSKSKVSSSAGDVGPYVGNPNNPSDPHNADSHWHAALGVYDCNHWLGDNTGEGIWNWPASTSEGSPGRVGTNTYAGLHSHDDGIIHMEPATEDDAGNNATVGRYFEYGGWKLASDGYSFLDTTVKNGDSCAGSAGQLQWSVNGKQQSGNPADYKLLNHDIVVIAFIPNSATLASIGQPPSVANLPNAGSTATTIAPLADASGKPCVKETGIAPPGAPPVPVKVGAPPKTLIIKDLKVGTGPAVKAGDTVTVDYIGVSCSTGTIFDSSYSRNQAATFPLSGVIQGWTNGIPGMRVGGMRLLGIPASQAYGAQGSPPVIAPNEALWFVVDMKGIGTTPPSTATPETTPATAGTADFKVDPNKTYTATITTNFGAITIALNTKDDPVGAGHFIKLAQAGFYNGSRWHRVAKDFVIQGGAPHGDPTASYGHAVVGEVPSDNYPLGAIAAAKTQTDPPGTFDSQFFIVTSKENGLSLPNDYARFGSVSGGMDVVQKIAALAPAGGDGEPTQTATIDKITISVR